MIYKDKVYLEISENVKKNNMLEIDGLYTEEEFRDRIENESNGFLSAHKSISLINNMEEKSPYFTKFRSLMSNGYILTTHFINLGYSHSEIVNSLNRNHNDKINNILIILNEVYVLMRDEKIDSLL